MQWLVLLFCALLVIVLWKPEVSVPIAGPTLLYLSLPLDTWTWVSRWTMMILAAVAAGRMGHETFLWKMAAGFALWAMNDGMVYAAIFVLGAWRWSQPY
jgi:hypothetical protein